MESIAGSTLSILLLTLSLGVIVPELFKKFRLPFVTSLIIAGAILGPFGVGYLHMNEVIAFFGFLGFTFLMFLAGLEAEVEFFKKNARKISLLACVNTIIPFATGFGISWYLGNAVVTNILLGAVFASSSVAIIVPSIKNLKLFRKETGQFLISTVMVEDMISLLVMAAAFQHITPTSMVPLPLHFLLVLAGTWALIHYLPRFAKFATQKVFKRSCDDTEAELRFILMLLIGLLTLFSTFGIHPILAAFLAGMLLRSVVVSDHLVGKFHTIGYGVFVPVFFVAIGMELDLSMLASFSFENMVVLTILFGLLLSKFVSGFVGGKLVGMSDRVSFLFGTLSMTHLTTALAITYAASSMGLFDTAMVSAIVLAAIITTIVVPSVVKIFAENNN